MKDKALEIIEHYGVDYQTKYFQSEVYELTEALIDQYWKEKYDSQLVIRRGRQHIAEEIADVRVMLLEFQAYYKISDAEIEEIMEKKIDRQIWRINNEDIQN